jgi:hypothetical protein
MLIIKWMVTADTLVYFYSSTEPRLKVARLGIHLQVRKSECQEYDSGCWSSRFLFQLSGKDLKSHSFSVQQWGWQWGSMILFS